MIDVGKKVGPYEIVSLISRGGMASTFLARRSGPGGFARHVAIKVIHPHLAEDKNFVDMFLDEARLSARIQHPNVVHTEELGEAEGNYYLVMEYIHGATLAQMLTGLSNQERRLSPAQAVYVGMRICDGLHAAHEVTDERGQLLGLVHRDISPQNILLSSGGHVKLIDFGVAKAAGRQQFSVTGALKGKYCYMSPEQARGERVDRRTDIYALGIVLWEILAMQRLFQGKNEIEVLDQVRNPEIRPPSAYMPGIPAAVDAVLMTALAREPDNRYQTARDLRVALAQAFPEAAAVDETQLAAILSASIGNELEEARQKLPVSVSGIIPQGMALAETQRAQMLHAYTQSAPGARYGRSDPPPSRDGPPPDEAVDFAPPGLPGLPDLTRPARGLKSSPPPGMHSLAVQSTVSAASQKKSMLSFFAAGAILVLGGVSVAVYLTVLRPATREVPQGIQVVDVQPGRAVPVDEQTGAGEGPEVPTESATVATAIEHPEPESMNPGAREGAEEAPEQGEGPEQGADEGPEQGADEGPDQGADEGPEQGANGTEPPENEGEAGNEAVAAAGTRDRRNRVSMRRGMRTSMSTMMEAMMGRNSVVSGVPIFDDF